MVPSFMCSGVHVDILQSLQRQMKMATNDVRRRNGFSRPSAEQKARLSVADELFEEGRNRRVDINLTKAIRCFESLFDSAVMNLLLDENGQKIWRDVLVDLDAKRFPDSQTSRTARDKNHPFSFLLPRSQALHHFGGEGRSVLLFLLDDRHVNELVVPPSRVDFLPSSLTAEATTILTTFE
jgi:hypothetical protein